MDASKFPFHRLPVELIRVIFDGFLGDLQYETQDAGFFYGFQHRASLYSLYSRELCFTPLLMKAIYVHRDNLLTVQVLHQQRRDLCSPRNLLNAIRGGNRALVKWLLAKCSVCTSKFECCTRLALSTGQLELFSLLFQNDPNTGDENYVHRLLLELVSHASLSSKRQQRLLTMLLAARGEVQSFDSALLGKIIVAGDSMAWQTTFDSVSQSMGITPPTEDSSFVFPTDVVDSLLTSGRKEDLQFLHQHYSCYQLPFSHQALVNVAAKGNIQTLRWFIKNRQIDPKCFIDLAKAAAQHNQYQVVYWMLEHQIPLREIQDHLVFNLLRVAVRYQSREVARYLYDFGKKIVRHWVATMKEDFQDLAKAVVLLDCDDLTALTASLRKTNSTFREQCLKYAVVTRNTGLIVTFIQESDSMLFTSMITKGCELASLYRPGLLTSHFNREHLYGGGLSHASDNVMYNLARNGCISASKTLFKYFPPFFVPTDILLIALEANQVDWARWLVKRYPKNKTRFTHQQLPFLRAVLPFGNLEDIKFVLKNCFIGESLDEQLMISCAAGNLHIVKWLMRDTVPALDTLHECARSAQAKGYIHITNWLNPKRPKSRKRKRGE